MANVHGDLREIHWELREFAPVKKKKKPDYESIPCPNCGMANHVQNNLHIVQISCNHCGRTIQIQRLSIPEMRVWSQSKKKKKKQWTDYLEL